MEINYKNIKHLKDVESAFRIIPSEEKDKICLPLPELVHDNAINCETKTGTSTNLVLNNKRNLDLSWKRKHFSCNTTNEAEISV